MLEAKIEVAEERRVSAKCEKERLPRYPLN